MKMIGHWHDGYFVVGCPCELPNPVVSFGQTDTSLGELTRKRIQDRIELRKDRISGATTIETRRYLQGQIDALEWVLAGSKEDES
jgi:hypothetical protein